MFGLGALVIPVRVVNDVSIDEIFCIQEPDELTTTLSESIAVGDMSSLDTHAQHSIESSDLPDSSISQVLNSTSN